MKSVAPTRSNSISSACKMQASLSARSSGVNSRGVEINPGSIPLLLASTVVSLKPFLESRPACWRVAIVAHGFDVITRYTPICLNGARVVEVNDPDLSGPLKPAAHVYLDGLRTVDCRGQGNVLAGRTTQVSRDFSY